MLYRNGLPYGEKHTLCTILYPFNQGKMYYSIGGYKKDTIK